MPFKYVAADKAPAKPSKKQSSKSADYFREILLGLQPGQVAAIEPEEGQSQRGIKVSVGRIASGLGLKATSWSVGDDPQVYVQLDDK